MPIHLKLAYCISTTCIQSTTSYQLDFSSIQPWLGLVPRIFAEFSNILIENFSKFLICTFYICSPSFYFGFFFFFFDRFLILLTFHLFCSSSSRHRLLVALNYLPIKLDYPYMRFYITIVHDIHEPWAMNHESIWWRSKLSVSDNRILNRKDWFGMSGIHSPK